MKAKVAFTIDQAVLKEIDALRDLATRSAFANEILKQGLKAYKVRKEPQERMGGNGWTYGRDKVFSRLCNFSFSQSLHL
jgi:metal-responsive CopG/Arc/MetJ family transcriptional regulator